MENKHGDIFGTEKDFNPDKYLKSDRLHMFLGLILLFVGIGIVYDGASGLPSATKIVEQWVGGGMLTAGMFDLIFITLVKKLKISLAKDSHELDKYIEKSHKNNEEIINKVDSVIKNTDDILFRTGMKSKLDSIALELKMVRCKIDPDFEKNYIDEHELKEKNNPA